MYSKTSAQHTTLLPLQTNTINQVFTFSTKKGKENHTLRKGQFYNDGVSQIIVNKI